MSLRVIEQIPENACVLDIGLQLNPHPVREIKNGVYIGVHTRSQIVDEYRVKYPRTQFFCFDVFGSVFPFDPDQFDVVVINEILNQIDNPMVMFTEIARVLKPNGRVYLVLPARWRWTLIRALGLPSEGERPERFWSKKDLEEKVLRTGLAFLDWESKMFGRNIFSLSKGDLKNE